MHSLLAKLVVEQWALLMGLAAGRRVASILQVRGRSAAWCMSYRGQSQARHSSHGEPITGKAMIKKAPPRNAANQHL